MIVAIKIKRNYKTKKKRITVKKLEDNGTEAMT
jgi:hypothetical protein